MVTDGRRYLRPPWVVRRIANPLLMKLGMLPVLAVRGRRSGQWRTVPVNVLEFQGSRFLVAPRGDTEWSRNLRAAGSGELRRRGSVAPFTAVEVPDAEKQPIIDAYLARWRGQVRKEFEALPRPEDHPVFRIEPASRN